ncbi:hypothetical protein [Dethiobacter alkaliphilus]
MLFCLNSVCKKSGGAFYKNE